jgi:hypothetical protein
VSRPRINLNELTQTLSVGIGALLACAIFFYYDNIVRRAQAFNKPWSQTPETRLPLACLGGPILASSLFWLVRLPLHPLPIQILTY